MGGIPVRVGIGPTKTLAKLLAIKQSKGWVNWCCLLEQFSPYCACLKSLPVNEVWGIGHNLSRRLNALHIYSSYDLMRIDTGLARKKFSVVLERTVRELEASNVWRCRTIKGLKNKLLLVEVLESEPMA